MPYKRETLAWRTKGDLALVLVFLSALVLPFVGAVLTRADVSEGEKRKLASWPALASGGDALRWPAGVSAFFADRFGGRTWLARGNAYTQLFLNQTAMDPRVIRGADGWLFFTPEHASGFRSPQAPVKGEWVDSFRRTLQSRIVLAGHAKYLLVVGPNKSTIYPELLFPDQRANMGPREIDALLGATPPIDCLLDVRSALMGAKKDHQLYFSTDTHWNPWGAMVASATIVRALGRDPIPAGALEESPTRRMSGDLSLMWNLPDLYYEQTGELRLKKDSTTTTQASGSRLLLIGDSFCNGLDPFLRMQFNVDHVDVLGKEREALLRQEAANFQPDFIVEVIVERNLSTWN